MNNQNKKPKSIMSIIVWIVGMGAFVIFVFPILGMFVVCGLLIVFGPIVAVVQSGEWWEQVIAIVVAIGLVVLFGQGISKFIKKSENRKKNKMAIKNQNNNIQQKEIILKQFSEYGEEEFRAVSAYIQQAQSQNYTREVILDKLITAGWQEEYVKEILKV